MSLVRWIWSYLFDCVHSHTTWPHRNQFGHAYVCCLDCGREMPYSLEFMQVVGQSRKPNIWNSRSPATVPRIIAGALLLLTPSYAVAQTAYSSADQSQTAVGDDNITPTLVIGFVGGFVDKDDLRHSEVQLARRLQETPMAFPSPARVTGAYVPDARLQNLLFPTTHLLPFQPGSQSPGSSLFYGNLEGAVFMSIDEYRQNRPSSKWRPALPLAHHSSFC